MNLVSKAVVWTVFCSALAAAGWKGREFYKEYRIISDAADEIGKACEVSGPPCLKHVEIEGAY